MMSAFSTTSIISSYSFGSKVGIFMERM